MAIPNIAVILETIALDFLLIATTITGAAYLYFDKQEDKKQYSDWLKMISLTTALLLGLLIALMAVSGP